MFVVKLSVNTVSGMVRKIIALPVSVAKMAHTVYSKNFKYAHYLNEHEKISHSYTVFKCGGHSFFTIFFSNLTVVPFSDACNFLDVFVPIMKHYTNTHMFECFNSTLTLITYAHTPNICIINKWSI